MASSFTLTSSHFVRYRKELTVAVNSVSFRSFKKMFSSNSFLFSFIFCCFVPFPGFHLMKIEKKNPLTVFFMNEVFLMVTRHLAESHLADRHFAYTVPVHLVDTAMNLPFSRQVSFLLHLSTKCLSAKCFSIKRRVTVFDTGKKARAILKTRSPRGFTTLLPQRLSP